MFRKSALLRNGLWCKTCVALHITGKPIGKKAESLNSTLDFAE
ncbi:hypothetical protein [Floridanema fluviatile]